MKMYSIGFLSTNIPYRLAQKGCKKHILCSQSIFGLLFSKQSFGCAHPIRSLHFWLKIYSLGASESKHIKGRVCLIPCHVPWAPRMVSSLWEALNSYLLPN